MAAFEVITAGEHPLSAASTVASVCAPWLGNQPQHRMALLLSSELLSWAAAGGIVEAFSTGLYSQARCACDERQNFQPLHSDYS
jgi:hypothetical protein